MKITFIKYKNDIESFNFFKGIGAKVYELEDLEKTDILLGKLVKENIKTIVISNEVASFSEDIIKKYKNSENFNIIIAPSKRIGNIN